ncbi:MAG: hypothetical protein QXS93_00525 [Candidatus Micrarchaeia archaeon]
MAEQNPRLKDDLRKMYLHVKTRNIRGLRDVSNVFTQDLLIFQDPFYLDLALCSMVLAKMIEKPRFWRYEQWKNILFSIEDTLRQAVSLAERNDSKGISRLIRQVLQKLGNVEKKDRRYVDTTIMSARVKIGSTLYGQGLSLGKASSLCGAPRDDILRYSGKTLISDRFGKTFSIKERLANVAGIFRD